MAHIQREAERRDTLMAIPKTVINLVRDEAMALDEQERAKELWGWLRRVER